MCCYVWDVSNPSNNLFRPFDELSSITLFVRYFLPFQFASHSHFQSDVCCTSNFDDQSTAPKSLGTITLRVFFLPIFCSCLLSFTLFGGYYTSSSRFALGFVCFWVFSARLWECNRFASFGWCFFGLFFGSVHSRTNEAMRDAKMVCDHSKKRRQTKETAKEMWWVCVCVCV